MKLKFRYYCGDGLSPFPQQILLIKTEGAYMKRRMLVMFLMVALCLQVGCAKQEEKTFLQICSKVDCLITAPDSSHEQREIWFQLPFFCMYRGEDSYSAVMAEKDEFVIGEDALLTGLHTEALDGATLLVNQTSLSDLADDGYYETMAALSGVSSESLTPSDTTVRSLNKVKKALSPYLEDTYVLSFNLIFCGCLSEAVSVESLQIPSLGFSFPFERFEIELMDLPDNVVYDEANDMITYTASSGVLTYGRIQKIGVTFLNGYANENIDRIELKSANDVCEVVNEQNHTQYAALEEMYGRLYDHQKLDGFHSGETMDLAFHYVLADEAQQLQNEDVLMVSLIVVTTDESGREHWSFRYEPNECPGEYLMFYVLYQDL